MKNFIILLFLIFSHTATSDTLSDSDKFFDWMESVYPQYLPGHQVTQVYEGLEDWYIRYYSSSNIYLGTYHAGEPGVYVYADILGGLLYLDTLEHLLELTGNNSAELGASLIQKAYIKASNTDSNDWFGYSVAISGNTLAVGAIFEKSSDTGINADQSDNSATHLSDGAVYVFIKDSNGTWKQQAYIKSSLVQVGELFGYSVALSNNTLVVGGPGNKSNVVHIFVRDEEGLWHEQEKLTISSESLSYGFGLSVAIEGDTLVVGSPLDSSGASGINGDETDYGTEFAGILSGSVHVYKREEIANSIQWIKQAYIKASNRGAEDNFGASIALSGDTLIVGAPKEDGAAQSVNTGLLDNSAPDAGAAYIFIRDEHDQWHQQAYLKTSNNDIRDEFGFSVAISGDTVVVGAPTEDSSASIVNGDQLDNDNPDSGAAYIFTRDTRGNWSQQAYLKASYSKSRYKFGSATAISNNAVVIGSFMEGKSGTGINSTPESGTDRSTASGSAYLFTRDGGNWSQGAYIKASNTGWADGFGSSLSLSDGILAIGARSESGSSTGVGSDESDNSAVGAGAVYIFE